MLGKKARGLLYPAILIVCMLYIYATLMGALLLSNRKLFFARGFLRLYSLSFLATFNALYLLCAYCYARAIIVRPAAPPRFWGFFLEQPEEKQKRMCMTCNCFKPERTHHCSTCGQCVLVMDHHCPWLNNCVGFSNRKMFMLLISYAFLLTCFVAVACPWLLYCLARRTVSRPRAYISFAFALSGYLLTCVGVYVMWGFVSYHYRLVCSNKTTIEEMDRKRGNNPGDYNFGPEFNWKFVFGANKLLWCVPWDKGIAAPFGDGVVMRLNELNETATKSQNAADATALLDDHSYARLRDWKSVGGDDPLNEFHRRNRVENPKMPSQLIDGFY